MEEDRYSNDVETAAALEQRRAEDLAWPEDEPTWRDCVDTCSGCGRELPRNQGPVCDRCWDRG